MKILQLLIMLLVLAGLPRFGIAGENPSFAIRGTWHSDEGTLTFTSGGTVNYRGTSYFYAVTNGGIIQLQSRHGSKALSYQLAGDKLTLTTEGKTTVYMRER